MNKQRLRRNFFGKSFRLIMGTAIVLIAFPGYQCESQSGMADQDSVGAYNVYEKAFNAAGISEKNNAWRSGQEMTVTLTMGKDSIILPGFWDGDSTWKFRVSLPDSGTWHWVVNADSLSFNGARGSFYVHHSSNKGFLRPHPDYPHSVSYSRKNTPVYVWGNTGYQIIVQALEGKTAVWHEFVDKSLKHGMNKTRMLVTMWNFGTPSINTKYCPWENYTNKHPRFNAFNTNYWKALDSIVRYMQQKEMIADLILFPDTHLLHAMTDEDEKRYVKYIIARYAAFTNVIWCIANEWNINMRERYEGKNNFPYFNPDNPNLEGHVPMSWVHNIGDYLYINDPYLSRFQRLTSVHNTGNHGKKINGQNFPYRSKSYHDHIFLFSGEDWATYDILQYHDPKGAINFPGNHGDGDDWGHYIIMQNRNDNVPVFNDEYGYEGSIGWRGGQVTTDKSRKAGWGIAIAGGYGSWGANLNDDFGDSGALLGVWKNNAKTPPAIKVMTNIMKGLDFWKMKSHDRLIKVSPTTGNAYLYANPGYQYLMYAANGGYSGSFRIEVKAGAYQGGWISTTSGEIVKNVEPFTLSSTEPVTFTAPDFSQNGDIVLRLVSTDNARQSSK